MTYAPTNPFTPGSDAWTMWEATGTRTLNPVQEALVDAANAAYDRQDQAWFDAQSTDDLIVLWALVSGINSFTPPGGFDDEVHDALHARGWFDAQREATR